MEYTIDRQTYSIAETGRILGISRSHAYRLASKGELQIIQLGNRKVISRRVIEKILSEEKEGNRDGKRN